MSLVKKSDSKKYKSLCVYSLFFLSFSTSVPTQRSTVGLSKVNFHFQWVISDFKKLQDQKATVQGPMIQCRDHPLRINLSFTNSCIDILVHRQQQKYRLEVWRYMWLCNCSITIPKLSITVKVPDIQLDSLCYKFCSELIIGSVEYIQNTLNCTTDATLTVGIKGFVNYSNEYDYNRCVDYFVMGSQNPLEKIFKNGTFSDLNVKSCREMETFRVHRAVLASASDTLKQQLEDKSNPVVELGDVSRDDVRDILTYIYSGTPPVFRDNAKDVLMIADRFGLEDLANECIFELLKTVTPTNVADCLTLASKLGISRTFLESSCIGLIKQNSYSVYRSESWKALRESSLQLAMDTATKCALYK